MRRGSPAVVVWRTFNTDPARPHHAERDGYFHQHNSEAMQTAIPTDLKPYFLTLGDIDVEHGGVLDWPALFGNDNPVELDIGCGRGLHLVNAGLANPDINYLGIEIDFGKGRRGAERLKKREMPNARVLGGDVFIALTKLIRPRSVAAIHVYFPDPWWKRRHRQRRVFNRQFVDLCAAALRPGGVLHSWTDVEEYFGVISRLMDNHEQFETVPAPQERLPEHDMDYQTSFERKKRKAGLPIYRGRWRRLTSQDGLPSPTGRESKCPDVQPEPANTQ